MAPIYLFYLSTLLRGIYVSGSVSPETRPAVHKLQATAIVIHIDDRSILSISSAVSLRKTIRGTEENFCLTQHYPITLKIKRNLLRRGFNTFRFYSQSSNPFIQPTLQKNTLPMSFKHTRPRSPHPGSGCSRSQRPTSSP